MGIPPGVPVKAAKSIGPCPSYCRADCPGTQRPAHPPGACPGVPAAWLPAAAYGKYSLSETDVQGSANDANGATVDARPKAGLREPILERLEERPYEDHRR